MFKYDLETGKLIKKYTLFKKGESHLFNDLVYNSSSDDFKVVSSFRITKGRGPHWTQPVIHNGVLYIRHGDVLMAFNIKV